MSARMFMRHRCTIERDEPETDELGAETGSAWKEHLPKQPCHVWFKTSKQEVKAGMTAAIEGYMMLLPLDVEVRTGDRIVNILDRRETSMVLAGPLLVETIGQRADHQVLTLKEVA